MARRGPQQPPPGVLPTPFLGVVRALLVLASLADGYLAWVSWTGGPVAGCGPESGCQTVLASRWAYCFGLPVSLIALPVYLGILAASTGVTSGSAPARRQKAWTVLFLSSAVVLGAGLWFASLQLFVLKAICPLCMATHGAAGLAAGLLLSRAPMQRAPAPGRSQVEAPLPPQLVGKLLGAALAALALLAVGQVRQTPKTFVSDPIVAGVTTNLVEPTIRQFQIFDGEFRFDLNDVPLIGSPQAPHVIVSLFDYTCHHCRQMHIPLMEAQRHFSNLLAIVSLPMPLDGKCNPIVKRTLNPHTNACALARLGLAVWRADRKAASAFDDWLFEPATPPPPEEAEQHAQALIGAAALETARNDPWIDQRIRQDGAIYEASYRRYRKGYMPQIVIGTNLLSSTFSRAQLFGMLSNQFGLTPP